MDLNSTDYRIALGVPFTTKVELTRPIVKDGSGKYQVNGKTFTDYLQLSYRDSGPFSVSLFDRRYNRSTVYLIRSDLGSSLGTLGTLVETGTRQFLVRGRSEDTAISILNDSHLNSRLASVTQMVTVVPT